MNYIQRVGVSWGHPRNGILGKWVPPHHPGAFWSREVFSRLWIKSLPG